LGDFVDIVGQGIQGDMQDYFNNLSLAVTSRFDGIEVGIRNMAALKCHTGGKMDGCRCFQVRRIAVSIRRNFGVIQLRYVFAEIGMCG
jgi:hypothetical protein